MTELTHLSYSLRKYTIQGNPETLDSFILMRAQKVGEERYIFRSRENLLHNTEVMNQLRVYAPLVADARRDALHVQRDFEPQTEGEPNLFFVEDTAKGIPLSDILKAEKLPTETVVEYIIQLLEALAAFHMKGLVYGALDPRFLFLVSDRGGRKLKLGGLFHVHKVDDVFPIGYNPEFSAPEMVNNVATSSKGGDVYSAGMLAYRMLLHSSIYEAQFPNVFNAQNAADRVGAWRQYHASKYSASTPFTSLRLLAQEIPAQISNVIEKMMNIGSEAPFADALEARTALEKALSEARVEDQLNRKTGQTGMGWREPVEVTVKPKVQGRSARKSAIAVLAASVILSVIAGGAYYQFVTKPAAIALQKALETVRGSEQTLIAARNSAVAAVNRLSPENNSVRLFNSAETEFTQLQKAAVTEETQPLQDLSSKMSSLAAQYTDVAQAVAKQKEGIIAAIDATSTKVASLAELVPANAAIEADARRSLLALRSQAEAGELDAIRGPLADLDSAVGTEIANRIEDKTSVGTLLEKLRATGTLLGTLYPANDAALNNAAGSIAEVAALAEDRAYDEALSNGNELANALGADVQVRQQLAKELEQIASTASASLNQTETRLGTLTEAQNLRSKFTEAVALRDKASEAFANRDFTAAQTAFNTVIRSINEISQAVSDATKTAEERLRLIETMLAEYSNLVQDGVAVPSDLRQKIDGARAAFTAGDSSKAALLSQNAASDLEALIEGAKASSNDARILAEAARSKFDAFAQKAPENAKLNELSAALITLFSLLDKKDFRAVGEAVRSFDEQITNEAAGHDAASQELLKDLSDAGQTLKAAPDADLGELKRTDLESELNAVQVLIASGSLSLAKDKLAEFSAKLEDSKIKTEHQQIALEKAAAQAQNLIARHEALEFRKPDEIISLSEAIKGSATGDKAEALAALESASAAFLPVVEAAEQLSSRIAGSRASVSRATENAGSAGIAAAEALAAAQPSIAKAEEAVIAGRFLDAAAAYDAAAAAITGLVTVKVADVDKLKRLQVQITERLNLARKTQALEPSALEEIQAQISALPVSDSQTFDSAVRPFVDRLEAALGVVAQEANRANAARNTAMEISKEISGIDGHAERQEYREFAAKIDVAEKLHGDGAFVASSLAFEELAPAGKKLLDILRRPPAMNCEVENGLAKMKQVNGGTYDAAAMMQRARFATAFGNRLANENGRFELSAQFCIQAEPLTFGEFSQFVSDADPITKDKISQTLLQGAETDPVAGIPRETAEQYAAWLSTRSSRTYRLPTIQELLAADAFPGANGEIVPSSRLVWTKDNCSDIMAVAGMVPSDLNKAVASCRLELSDKHSDVFVRLVLEDIGGSP